MLDIVNLRGVDCLKNGHLVTLEGAPDYMVERWDIRTDVSFTGFMVGGRGDDDELFNNPLDIAVGKNDQVYVLDILSDGSPRVKVFDKELNPLGGYGDSTMIPGTPKRISYDKAYGEVHILTADDVVRLKI